MDGVFPTALVFTLLNWTLVAGWNFPFLEHFQPYSDTLEDHFVLDSEDFAKDATNPYNLTFIINEPDICNSSIREISIISVVSSAPDHFKHRSAIRRTWGSRKLYSQIKMATVFFVGLTAKEHITNALHVESETYRDIVQADFIDAYRNNTYKFVSELTWVNRYCPQSRYILKTDDDVYIDVFKIDSEMAKLSTPCFVCSVVAGAYPFRSTDSKWFVTKTEYPLTKYPTYCNGPALMIHTSQTSKLLYAASKTKYFWVDDVLVTGVFASLANIGHFDLKQRATMMTTSQEYLLSKIKGDSLLFAHLVGTRSINWLPILWKARLDKQLRDHPIRTTSTSTLAPSLDLNSTDDDVS